MKDWKYEPALDHGLSSSESRSSIRREGGLFSRMFRGAWWCLARSYLAAAHRLTIHGREHVPAEPPFILVANHSSHLDVVSLIAALPVAVRHHTYALAAGDTFFESLAPSLFATLCINALPMERRRGGRHSLEFLRSRLHEGPCAYILFPEGTRSRDGTPAPFKPGLGMLVAGTDVPVVPCHIDGAFAALPPHRRLPRFRKLTLRIGAPRTFADAPNRKDGWRAIAEDVERAVRACEIG